jgi:hypothetical protein
MTNAISPKLKNHEEDIVQGQQDHPKNDLNGRKGKVDQYLGYAFLEIDRIKESVSQFGSVLLASAHPTSSEEVDTQIQNPSS